MIHLETDLWWPLSCRWGFPSAPCEQDISTLQNATYLLGTPRTFSAVIVAISVHVSLDLALQSGIFGLLGDAPIRMLDVNDSRRLQEFESFYKRHIPTASNHESSIMFNTIKSHHLRDWIQSWKDKLDESFLKHFWRTAFLADEVSIEDPDKMHPFMITARRLSCKVKSHIMFRHCEESCS